MKLIVLQGRSESGGAQQPVAAVAGHALHGLVGARHPQEEAAAAGPRQPGPHRRHRQGRQPSHTGVPVPVQEPALELHHQELPQGEESVRQDRRSR